MKLRHVPSVSPEARELVSPADRAIIAELAYDLDGWYSITADPLRGTLAIRVYRKGDRTILDLTGEPRVITEQAIDALRAWIAVSEGALDGVSVR